MRGHCRLADGLRGEPDASVMAALEADAAEGAQLCQRCARWSADIKVCGRAPQEGQALPCSCIYSAPVLLLQPFCPAHA